MIHQEVTEKGTVNMGRPRLIAGVDIGNSTTEAAIAVLHDDGPAFLGSSCVRTTGIKGTRQNDKGAVKALLEALSETGYRLKDLDVVCINDAAPVLSDLSMSTVTETLITESAMIGHNPTTPGGVGIGKGETVLFNGLHSKKKGKDVIAVVGREVEFEVVAKTINNAKQSGINIQGVIAQNNDGVLISNRLESKIPIVDEVKQIAAVPIGMPAVVEVAAPGRHIEKLCNPYGIAGFFDLSPAETKTIAPLAVSLIGNRSAVVIRTPRGGVSQKTIPAGKLTIIGHKYSRQIDVTEGAQKIVAEVERLYPISNVIGEAGSAAGGMLAKLKHMLGQIVDQSPQDIWVGDLFAADTLVPQQIKGSIAGEVRLSSAVALAALIQTETSMIKGLQKQLSEQLCASLNAEGIESHMSLLGAATTPGVDRNMVVVDMGAGTIDAALFNPDGSVNSTHLAGAGDMTRLLISTELGLSDVSLAEDIKIHPLAKVESPFHIICEDGTWRFFSKPLERHLFGKTVVVKPDDEMTPLPLSLSLQRIVSIRQNAKRKVFLPNVVRALKRILPAGNLRSIDSVVLIGGCALDFEVPDMLSEELLNKYGIICGKGRIRGELGPRNAVATGLLLSFFKKYNGRC